jgi:hypothetical protein
LSDWQKVQHLHSVIGRREAEDARAIAAYSPGRLLVVAVIIASVACAAVGARSLLSGRSPLTFRTEGGEVQGNGYLPTLREQEASERSPLETDISILRALLANQDIGAGTDQAESLRGARLRRDPAHAAKSGDPVTLPATAPRPGPSQKR